MVVGAIGLSSSTPAGAAGVTHRTSSASTTNLSSATEKPTLSFSCNDVTGKFTLKVTNVQIIQPDHVTAWSSLRVAWAIAAEVPFTPKAINLAQNSTNGLYTATSTGVLANVADCATGRAVQVVEWTDQPGAYPWNGYTNGWLWLEAVLS
jgi:hypothetical protein